MELMAREGFIDCACGSSRTRTPALGLVILALTFPIPALSMADFHFAGGIADELDGRSTHVAALGMLIGDQARWELSITHFGERRMHRQVPSRTVVSAARRFGSRRFLFLFGPAVNDHGDEILSGHWQWMSGIETSTRFGRLSIRHLSNGGMTGRNRGETWLQWSVPFGGRTGD